MGIITNNLNYEHKLWTTGYRIVAGADEVGRGCFAGPVVAGCCIFPPKIINTIFTSQGLAFKSVKIDDSKKLTAVQRKKASEWIKENALSWGIGVSSVSLINKLGIVKATRRAFRLAIKNLNTKIDFLLIDAFYVPYVRGVGKIYQNAIIGGDRKSFSIAAGSIVAKVHRDNIMETLGGNKRFQKYGWHRNKGYGTKEHRDTILKYGITRHHRKQFVNTFLLKYQQSTADNLI